MRPYLLPVYQFNVTSIHPYYASQQAPHILGHRPLDLNPCHLKPELYFLFYLEKIILSTTSSAARGPDSGFRHWIAHSSINMVPSSLKIEMCRKADLFWQNKALWLVQERFWKMCQCSSAFKILQQKLLLCIWKNLLIVCHYVIRAIYCRIVDIFKTSSFDELSKYYDIGSWFWYPCQQWRLLNIPVSGACGALHYQLCQQRTRLWQQALNSKMAA